MTWSSKTWTQVKVIVKTWQTKFQNLTFFGLKSWQWLHYPSIDSEFSEANMFKSNTHMPSHSEDLSGKHLGLSGKYMLCLENLRFADIQNDDDDKLGKMFCNDNRCWLYLWVCSCTNLNNIPSTMHHLWPKLFCRKMHPDTTKQCHAWRRCLANNVNLQSVVSCLNLLYVVSCCLQIYKMII